MFPLRDRDVKLADKWVLTANNYGLRPDWIRANSFDIDNDVLGRLQQAHENHQHNQHSVGARACLRRTCVSNGLEFSRSAGSRHRRDADRKCEDFLLLSWMTSAF